MKYKKITLLIALLLLNSCSVGNRFIQWEGANLYQSRLFGLKERLEESYLLEPYLMCTQLEIEFENNGNIVSVAGYIYGYDEDYQLKSGYQFAFNPLQGNQLKVMYHNWKGNENPPYDQDSNFDQLCWMADQVNLQQIALSMSSAYCGLASYGLRNSEDYPEGVYAVTPEGVVRPYPPEKPPFQGLSFLVYGIHDDQGNFEKAKRYIYHADES